MENTGQLFFRETDKKSPDGRDIMMVVGLMAFEKPPEGEHQYTVVGNGDALTLLRETATDLTDSALGCTLGDMVMRPIWRV